MSILIKNGLVVTQNWKREVLKGDVLVDGGKIAAVGHVKSRPDEVVDASGCIVIPGLINCHTHVAMTLMRSVADDVGLEGFLEKTFAIDSKRIPEDIEVGAALGCLEMARSGTTTFLDLYYSEDAIAKSAEEGGLRAYLGWAVLDEELTTQKGKPIKNCEAFVKAYKGKPLVKPVVAPQGVYVCGRETLAQAKELAAREGTFCHYHLSETRYEVYEHQRKTGKRPVEYLADIGFLSKGDVAAHGVWLTMSEVRQLANAGVAVAHCPTSNMKLASGGVAPLPEMFAEGVTVGLGTDGCSSNNGLDMFLEMKFCSLLHKSHRWDASVLNAQKCLDLATIDGAKCLGAEKQLGSIEVGKKADLVVIDCNTPAMTPTTPENAVANLIYAGPSHSVRDTMVEGRFVISNWKATTVDEKKLLRKAQDAAAALMSKAR
ncbi:MAG: amidohydrolase family protein [Candidatus Thermoplasmatota archaeon]|nr:amidohydrolase family protein [Candidatus Thermoplasmatota archaeon]